jgi:methionyl-tRNA formyltransferase
MAGDGARFSLFAADARFSVMRAVVFAYHNVGVRCLSVLLAHDVDVAMVVTHDDDPDENVWFESVEGLALLHRLTVVKPADPNTPELMRRIAALRPDFLFSFYYRKMLAPGLLDAAARGALNMHGSLLPRYRGRAPVNWVLVEGQAETGVSLHYMVEKPDAGGVTPEVQEYHEGRRRPVMPDQVGHQYVEDIPVDGDVALYRHLSEGKHAVRARALWRSLP